MKEKEKLAPGEEKATITFNGGKLVSALLSGQAGDLIAVLNKAGKLTDQQAGTIRTRAKGMGDKPLAMRLIGANYVTHEDITNSIKSHTLDIVYNLLTWHAEPFRFDDNVVPKGERILVPIDLENVIIEGSRRQKHQEELIKHIPNLDMALKFPENPKQKFKGIHLNVEEWRVVSFVNPKNTMRQIAKANNMSDMEIRRVVYGLEQAGLVHIVKPAGTEKKPSGRTKRPGRARDRKRGGQPVQKDVINKLINRIRNL